jgi:hypothetical protein
LIQSSHCIVLGFNLLSYSKDTLSIFGAHFFFQVLVFLTSIGASNGPEGVALILGDCKDFHTGPQDIQNYNTTLDSSTKEPKKQNRKAIRSLTSVPRLELHRRSLSLPLGTRPVGAARALSVDDTPRKGLHIEG